MAEQRPDRVTDLYLSPSAKRAHVINGIVMPGSSGEKAVAHGLGVKPQGWRTTSIRAPAGVPAEQPNEIRRDKNVIVLATATAETIDIEVW